MNMFFRSVFLVCFCFSNYCGISSFGKQNVISYNLKINPIFPFRLFLEERLTTGNNSSEFLKILDYDKKQTNLYAVQTGKLLKSINSTYDHTRFMYNSKSKVFEVWENWNFESGKVKQKLLQEIPFNNPRVNRNNEISFENFLDNNFIAFYLSDSGYFYIADLSSEEISSFNLNIETTTGFPYNCEETTGICIIGTKSDKVYVFDYKNKSEIDTFSVNNSLISEVATIIPNSPYVIIQDNYREYKLLNYKTKTINEMEEDWPYGNYRTYPNNNGSKALFFETSGGGFPGYAALIDLINRQTLFEYNCPSTESAMELDSADISSDGQYIALGCRDNKGNEDRMDDSGIVFVLQTTNPGQIIYSIDSIGLGITEKGSQFTNVEFYQ